MTTRTAHRRAPQPLRRTMLVAIMLPLAAAALLWLQAARADTVPAKAADRPGDLPVAVVNASAGNAAPATPAASAASAAPASGAAPAAIPAAAGPPPTPAALDQRVQDLKAEVMRLNRDLLVLEEELLYPAGTQVALFVSMDVGKLFELESVQIKLGDQVVASHLYTPLEVQALHRGGVQRVFVGNLKTGEHRIDAFFTGRGPHERDYKRGTTLKFEKGGEPKYIELRIKDSQAKLQPEFEVKVWQ